MGKALGGMLGLLAVIFVMVVAWVLDSVLPIALGVLIGWAIWG